MAITYGTLAQEVDGKVEYVYPKTIASIVEYDDSDSVKTKIEKIDKNITGVSTRLDNIVSAIKYGSLGTYNDAELIDIRIPNYNVVPEDTVYESAGNAVRGQFEEVINLIDIIREDLKLVQDTYVSKITPTIETLHETVTVNKTKIENLQEVHVEIEETIKSIKLDKPLDENGNAIDGEKGQVLESNGDGATSWVYHPRIYIGSDDLPEGYDVKFDPNATGAKIDKTLSIEGALADAKAVGDAINKISANIGEEIINELKQSIKTNANDIEYLKQNIPCLGVDLTNVYF